ncbi:MAG: class I SAM-dependent methyltransferase [Melioribacteraceae bacterium]|nr:class I SAM-dependent methyltransferase [Melioribacteraceae bacterium]MCF8356998.1 class I SAM-dependent methyltransferase [Melioribacteraceae bacterium]MCF8396459.1 class I SAM-dependent methyltransferase [Melioribacteraceae bacterium]
MKEKWDERYGNSEYIYGVEPNNFLSKELAKLKPGKILMPGEGEGRNAVYAAKNGWEVDAFDYSEKAKEKAEKLASENSVKINYRVADITELSLPFSTYDAAAIIFMHLDEKLREDTHKNINC